MPTCPRCGTPCERDDRYCGKCGQRLLSALTKGKVTLQALSVAEVRYKLGLIYYKRGELSEAIFGIDESVDVEVYDNNETRFEIFITQTEEKRGYEHVCIEIDNKKEFIDRCKQYGIKPMFITKGGKNLLFVRDFSGNLFEIKEK